LFSVIRGGGREKKIRKKIQKGEIRKIFLKTQKNKI